MFIAGELKPKYHVEDEIRQPQRVSNARIWVYGCNYVGDDSRYRIILFNR